MLYRASFNLVNNKLCMIQWHVQAELKFQQDNITCEWVDVNALVCMYAKRYRVNFYSIRNVCNLNERACELHVSYLHTKKNDATCYQNTYIIQSVCTIL
jgi:hypothetical protein